MPINTDLLVCTKDLQQYLVDKTTGEALSAGVVTCYKDSSRTTLKNWYYQSGSAQGYTYSALPNPLTLSASGTIVDQSGNDTLPFYFPYSEADNSQKEPYYITVDSSDGTRQFIRQNFPFMGDDNTANTVPTMKNYIVNNNFWRQASTTQSSFATNSENSVTLTNQLNYVIAPSQHDGFSMPDWRFIKNIAGATDTLTFKKFSLGSTQLTGDPTPEWYVNFNCSALQAGETQKSIQVPLSLHLKTMTGLEGTFTFQARNAPGAQTNIIKINTLEFCGTGATSPGPVTRQSFTLTDNWQKYKIPFIFNSGSGVTLSHTGDDAWYLQIEIPHSVTCNFDFCLPSLYLDSDVPTNNLTTYSETDAIINSPRTGDYRHSLNSFQPYGWVPANDGTIGAQASGATTRANQDTWPLYNLLYNSPFLDHWAPVAGRTGNAATDFTNNLPMYLTKNLGRVLAGLNPVFLTPTAFTATVTAVNFSVTGFPTSTVAVAATLTAGTPIQVTTSGGGVLPRYRRIYGAILTPEADFPMQTSTTYYVSSSNNVPGVSVELTIDLADAVAGTNSMVFTTNSTATCTIVNTVNVLTLTTAQSPVLNVGTPVQVSNTGGSLPSGLSANTVYYVTSTSLTATTITLSDNLTDAQAGYFIPILTAGTGTQTLTTAVGAYNGAGYTTDVPRHVHPFSSDGTFLAGGNLKSTGGGVVENFDNVTGTTNFNTNGIEKVSLMQPTAFCNVYIKL